MYMHMIQIHSNSLGNKRFHAILPIVVFIFGIAFIGLMFVALSGPLYSAPKASGPTSCPAGMKIKTFANRKCTTNKKGQRTCKTTQDTTCVVNQFYNPNKTLQNP